MMRLDMLVTKRINRMIKMMNVEQGVRSGNWTVRKLYIGREERAVAKLIGISELLLFRHNALIETYRSLLSSTKLAKLERAAS